MQLRPCGQCRRHVDTDEARCPFCRAVLATSSVRVLPVGTLSRAAVFAGATFASGCWTSTPAKTTTPDEQGPVEQKPAAVAPGEIRGVVRDGVTKAPLVGARVLLQSHETRAQQQGLTDQGGEFVFSGLPPGGYSVTYPSEHPRQAPITVTITLSPETGQRADLWVQRPEIDHGPCCKPYGAPPARRRIV